MQVQDHPPARGRPRGQSAKGKARQKELYDAAVFLFARDGYDATSLQDIARHAGVSPSLLYKYFPRKIEVVEALYDALSAEFVDAVEPLPKGRWHTRGMHALKTSFAVLGPHRRTLRALTTVLVTDDDHGVLGRKTSPARQCVLGAFEAAVTGATNAPAGDLGRALAHQLYLVHLALLLWWLLDKSPAQRATHALLAHMERLGPLSMVALKMPGAAKLVRTIDALAQDGLWGRPAPPER